MIEDKFAWKLRTTHRNASLYHYQKAFPYTPERLDTLRIMTKGGAFQIQSSQSKKHPVPSIHLFLSYFHCWTCTSALWQVFQELLSARSHKYRNPAFDLGQNRSKLSQISPASRQTFSRDNYFQGSSMSGKGERKGSQEGVFSHVWHKPRETTHDNLHALSFLQTSPCSSRRCPFGRLSPVDSNRSLSFFPHCTWTMKWFPLIYRPRFSFIG